jgi:chromosome segregation ATPase
VLKDSTQVKESAISEVRRADADKQRVFELEEEVARLRRKADLEQAQRILTLTQQLDMAEDRVKELESMLERHERERKESSTGRKGSEDEGRSLRMQELQDHLEALRRDKRELEGKLLQRDSDNIELHFDLEARNLECDRVKRRLQEVEASYRLTMGAGAKKEQPEADAERKAGGRFKRERDLEGVVDALKRVVEKLRAENERLRRGAADNIKLAEAEKKAKELKARNAELQDEVMALKARVSSGDEASQRLTQKQELLNQLRKQLRIKDDVVRTWQQRVEALEGEKEATTKEMERANLRVLNLEKELIGLRRTSRRDAGETSEVDRLRAQVSEQRDVIEALRAGARRETSARSSGESQALQEIARLKDELRQVERGGGGARGGPELRRLKEENRELRELNDKLNSELQAFDLNFFEEIEDLKWKYKEACAKLEKHERR